MSKSQSSAGSPPVASRILQQTDGLSNREAEILGLIADHARMTNAAVAEATHMPASTSLLRMQELRARGVIRGFHTDVDRHALGLNMAAMVAVELDKQNPDVTRHFFVACRALPHVMAVLNVSGSYDFLLLAYVMSTDQLLKEVIHPLDRLPHVWRTDTSIVFEHWQRRSCVGDMTPA